MAFWDVFDPIIEFVEAAAPYVKTATAVAGTVGAVAPFFLEGEELKAPAYQAPSAQDLQSEAAAEANRRRREIARRRGAASTIRTPLGVGQDLSVKTAGILGV